MFIVVHAIIFVSATRTVPSRHSCQVKVKVKQTHYRPGQACNGIEAPIFQDSRHMKMVRLSALRTGRLYPQEIFLVLISVRGSSRPQGHRAAGRIMSMKKSNYTIGNQTRGRIYPQETFLVLISVRGRVDPRAIVQPEELRQ
jgi:hypothetical protein